MGVPEASLGVTVKVNGSLSLEEPTGPYPMVTGSSAVESVA